MSAQQNPQSSTAKAAAQTNLGQHPRNPLNKPAGVGIRPSPPQNPHKFEPGRSRDSFSRRDCPSPCSPDFASCLANPPEDPKSLIEAFYPHPATPPLPRPRKRNMKRSEGFYDLSSPQRSSSLPHKGKKSHRLGAGNPKNGLQKEKSPSVWRGRAGFEG